MKKEPVPNMQLRQARLKRRLGLAKAAELAGVSIEAYSRWEYGTQEPRLSSLDLLCTGFNCSPDELGFEHLVRVDSHAATPMQGQDGKTTWTLSVEHRPTAERQLAQDLFSLGIMALITSQQQNGWSIEELYYMIDKEIKHHSKAGEGTTRRDACAFLISVPLAFLNMQGTTAGLTPSESLPLFSAGVPACWKLYYNDGDMNEIERTVGIYLHQLEPLAQSSEHEEIAANLASQSYQLASMLSLECEDYTTATAQANHAIDYAQLTADQNIHAAAIMRKAIVLHYQKRYRQMSVVLRSAMPLVKAVSPLMQARIYSGLGTDVTISSRQDALRYVQMAIDMCPDDVEADPAYSYTFISPYVLHLNQEIVYTNLGQHKDAWQSLANAEKHLDIASSTRRMELMTHQAATAIALGKLDLSAEKVETMIQVNRTLSSDLSMTDIKQLYQQLCSKWRNEKKVKDIGELLQANHH